MARKPTGTLNTFAIVISLSKSILFAPCSRAVNPKKRWILGLPQAGTLFVDAGAERALRKRKSLFIVGVVRVEGYFAELSAVSIAGPSKLEFARGLVNVSAQIIREEILKRPALTQTKHESMSRFTSQVLEEEIMHRSAIVLIMD